LTIGVDSLTWQQTAAQRTQPYCVIAQRFSSQPLDSLRWPAAEQKHTPLVIYLVRPYQGSIP